MFKRLCCLFQSVGILRHLHSFPTRRSSDLEARHGAAAILLPLLEARGERVVSDTSCIRRVGAARRIRDRKSTRLNSSHLVISYAVFCLKKKRKSTKNT